MENRNRPPRRLEEDRKKRIPLGGNVQKMNAPERRGYVRRWVNDRPGRLKMFQDAGYEFVVDPNIQIGERSGIGHNDVGEYISMHVGVDEKGGSIRAYLMEIKKEFYDEDQAVKMERRLDLQRQIRGGMINGKPGQDGRYIPEDGIKYDIS